MTRLKSLLDRTKEGLGRIFPKAAKLQIAGLTATVREMKRVTLLAVFSFLLAGSAGIAPADAAVPLGYFTDPKPVPNINTTDRDYAQTVSADGLTLIFGSGGQLYQATRDSQEEAFDYVVSLDSINTPSEGEDYPSMTDDGLTLYFNRGPIGLGPVCEPRVDLFQACRNSVDEPFHTVHRLPGILNGDGADATPFISRDGLTLLFSSCRPGGMLDFDLMIATRKSVSDEFGIPVNLNSFQGAAAINTENGEIAPTLSSDGRLLLFTSSADRPGGEGGLDIWASYRASVDSPFGEVVNLNTFSLGSSINTGDHQGMPFLSRDWPAHGSKLYYMLEESGGPFDRDIWEATWILIKDIPRPPSLPVPDDGQTDVFSEVDLSWTADSEARSTNVYFGTSRDAVRDANTANPLGVLVSQEQNATRFDPGRLEFNQTYYWRVDEVNGATDRMVFEGNVWSFTTEPILHPIANITATASGVFGVSVPENTINGSGLVDDLHGTDAADMWISAGIPATIEYAFDRAYQLHELWLWNSNQLIEPFVGFGAKDVVIEHSLDGETWTILEGVGPLARAPGTDGYAHNTTIDFGGTVAQHVRVNIDSVHGVAPQASLSEVRFSYLPVSARNPQPALGAGEETLDTILSWRPGREAASHRVFFSQSVDAVVEDRALIATTTEPSFDPSDQSLNYGTTYYWKVNEVNDLEMPNVHAGNLWHFMAPAFISVDDMESYRNDNLLEIWNHWIDGFDDLTNGSMVGNGTEPERLIVHEGLQSLPMVYDNGTAPVSEATHTFDPPLDWIRGEPEVLLLFFRGLSSNDPAPLYLVITDGAGQAVQVVHPDPLATQVGEWTEWAIPLGDLGSVNLSGVQSITLGIGGEGGTNGKGTMYFDSIRVGTPLPPVEDPTAP